MPIPYPPRPVPPSLGAYLRATYRYDAATRSVYAFEGYSSALRPDQHYPLPGAVTTAPDAIPNLRRVSPKQISYALHYDCIPKWITHYDDDATNLDPNNLRGESIAPRWRDKA